MKGSVIALGSYSGRKAAALMVDGKLQDVFVDSADASILPPGTIIRAICDRPMKGQGGMMVRLPDDHAYLRQAKGMKPGQPVLVQVSGYAEAGKATAVTARVLFKSRYAIVTPDAPGLNISRSIKDEEERVRLREIATEATGGVDGAGLIIRSQAVDADDAAVAEDIAAMLDVSAKVLADADGSTPDMLLDGDDAHALAWREWQRPDLFADGPAAFADHGIDEALSEMTARRADYPAGVHAYVEPTKAIVAVDVNTGPDTSFAAGLKANIAVARDLPRQLRCRGLGGQITVDFAPAPKKDRRQIEAALKSAFRADPVDTALAGWTPLGHFELQRKRERAPLI